MISNRDVLVVGYNLGRIVRNIGILCLFPIPIAVMYMEWSVIPDFMMGAAVSFMLGYIMQILFYTKDGMKLRHAMVVSALAWIIGSLLAGLPLWTTGSVNSVLDGIFDGMSGWTTSGLSLMPDIDHLSHAVNFWRHFLQFVGGAGIVVFSLALLTKEVSGSVRLYASEGREERIFPSITKTAKVILGVCMLFLIFGSITLFIAGVYEGMPFGSALFDAVMTTMAAFSTGGFSPHSQNILFYHSLIYEVIAIVISVIGSFNFALHFAVLTGNRAELKKNIEVITFSATLITLTFIAMAFLLYFNVYADYMTLFRKGFFQIVSGHTTTGFQTINVIQFTREWPYLSLFAVIVSMILGASACSTGGGIKALRVGIIIKMFIGEIKKIILPENTVIVQKYHHIRPAVISDQIAKGALFVAAGYVILFTLGSLITMFYGYSMIDSMFETASAVGNTGLSVGVSSPNLDPTVKITYIILMWAGRLEITAVFVLLGFTYIAIRRLSYISGEVYHTGEKAAEKIIKPVKK